MAQRVVEDGADETGHRRLGAPVEEAAAPELPDGALRAVQPSRQPEPQLEDGGDERDGDGDAVGLRQATGALVPTVFRPVEDARREAPMTSAFGGSLLFR